MSTDDNKRRLSFFVLCAGLLVVCGVFGVPQKYDPRVYFALASAQLGIIGLAAWNLGGWAVLVEPEERRRDAVAGGLLITPFALFSLLAGFGPPELADAAMNHLRYVILIIDAFSLAVGLIILSEALREAGERVYSVLGFAAIVIATPLCVVFAAIQLGDYRVAAAGGSGQGASGQNLLDELSVVLLFFGGVLVYLATAAFATALGRTLWLGRKATLTFTIVSLIACLCLVPRYRLPKPGSGDEALVHYSRIRFRNPRCPLDDALYARCCPAEACGQS